MQIVGLDNWRIAYVCGYWPQLWGSSNCGRQPNFPGSICFIYPYLLLGLIDLLGSHLKFYK